MKVKRIIEIEDNYEGMSFKEALHELNDCVFPVVDSASVAFAIEIFEALTESTPYNPTVVVDCKNCDGYEAGYSAGVRDTERPQINVFCENADEKAIEDMKAELQSVIDTRPQDRYVDISKLRLMTVEECAGHTIDYAMGWKACIEWIKKGGAE